MGGSSKKAMSSLLSSSMMSSPSNSASMAATRRGGALSLPLLEGLCRRPGESDRVVQEVFSEWKAAVRIARYCDKHWNSYKNRKDERQTKTKRARGKEPSAKAAPPSKRRRRGGKKNKEEQQPVQAEIVTNIPKKKEQFELSLLTPTTASSQSIPCQHWLVQSLASPSVQDRQVACKILMQGCPLDDVSLNTCITILSHLIHTANPNTDYIASSAVGWIAILKHLVINVLSANERLAFCHSHTGLTEICSTLWKLALLANTGGQQRSQDITRICLSLVDLLHAFILKGTDTTAPEVHGILWSKGLDAQSSPRVMSGKGHETLTSPLEYLVATYHLWRDNFRNNKSLEMYLQLLKQLIDPSLLPKTTTADSYRDRNRIVDGRDRLAKTFANGDGKASNPTATTNSSPGNAAVSNRSSRRDTDAQAAAALDSSDAAVAALLESSPENRSVMESVSRLIGSLYSSNEGDHNQEGGHHDHDHVDEFEPMIETDNEEEDNAEEGLRNMEEDQPQENDDDNEDPDNDEREEEDLDQASSDEENNDEGEEDEENNDDEEDDEIESDEMEDDDDEDIVIHEDDLPGIEEGLLEFQRGITHHTTSTPTPVDQPSASGGQGLQDRSRLYVQAAMKVLSIQHPADAKVLHSSGVGPLFSISAEQALVTSILNIVKPQKKPFDGKICLRRAPTQEEFFRGSLSRNPVSFSMLAGNNQQEPTVRSLRQHIATELQMADSAEMLELLIAGKILDVDLKLRVVNQTVWKEHCIQLTNSSSGTTLSSLLGGGRSVSLMVTSSLGRSLGNAPSLSLTADSPWEHFPPMIMTYRLVGVDGEATEDTVSTLNDPEAPSEASSPEERERLMEEQFGITRLATQGRGAVCLIRSLEAFISDNLRKIRRDDVGGIDDPAHFGQSTYSGLTLLTCCAKLSSNRRLLLNARAPTALLRLLLDVLHALEGDADGQPSESNSTAKDLKELIENLATDISRLSSGASETNEMEEDDDNEAASTLRLLIQDIEASTLSPPLRNIIARLLPYLTYGKPKLSKELATEFMNHVALSHLGDYEGKEAEALGQTRSVLMDTFIHASMSLPSNKVCDSLRMELLNCGFVEQVTEYMFQKCPLEPPSWHAFLWPKEKQTTKQKQLSLEKQWREYCKRPGLKSCFDILVGLSKEHKDTQLFLAKIERGKLSFFQFCHWLESTSDHPSVGIFVKKLALVAEALLDDLVDFDTSASMQIKSIRKVTRERKKEIAMERRNKTLSKFGSSKSHMTPPGKLGDTAASLLAPVFGLFNTTTGSSEQTERPSSSTPSSSRKKKATQQQQPSTKPSWMAEMMALADETGLVCSVCQEGLENQPKSLLGLYVYVKRVALSSAESRIHTSGSKLLTILPFTLPTSVQDAQSVEWYQSGRAAGNELREEVSSAAAGRKRDMYYTTTVSACNANHLSCHERARLADRNHPKAPKSEWEGASLRNSRVNCNVILPLVSSRSSRVSLGAVEQALTDHQTAVANLIGATPKSNLWTVLHDVRLLLLRMAYGEPLNEDCGGGSLLSNSQLIFYQLAMAKSFDLEAQVDSPASSLHARAISAGFLAAREIISAEDYNSMGDPSLIRGIADASTIAALTSILFHNTTADGSPPTESSNKVPHPKRRWAIAKERFLRGLLNCAGCRHALGMVDSGCASGRSPGSKRNRSTSFAEWGTPDGNIEESKAARTLSGKRGKTNNRAGIEDFGQVLRPMLVFYAMMDQLSSDYTPDLDDPAIDESASRFVKAIESCYWSKNIHELLENANVNLSHSEILKELQRGMTAA